MKIPRDRLIIRSTHSSGPGGQNVNKVATKVEIRFHVEEADWLSRRGRTRLQELQKRRINQQGELVITSSRYRHKSRNLEDCIEKLEKIIEEASKRPRRRIPTKPTKASRQKRLEGKRKRSIVKRGRASPGKDDE